MSTILFFEDEDIFAKKLKDDLSRKLGSTVKVELAKPTLSKTFNKKTFVHRLLDDLKRNKKDFDLIVTDVNLYDIKSYEGLSAEVVGEVGRRLFIPVCIYSRNVPNDFERIQETVDSRIKLKEPPHSSEMIKEIAALYNGIVKLKRLYNKLAQKKKTETLPQVLAAILDRPQYVDRLSLYGLGNQAFLEFVPRHYKNIDPQLRSKTVPYLLGNLLLMSILKFPGVLLNKVAAASHLNIALEYFEEEKVSILFKKALYKGPFSDLDTFWWRYELDDIVDRNNLGSGLELARKKVNSKIKSCKCTVDPNLDAGYYCIITNRPVSLAKSTSEINWIPKGADLARVSTPVYNRLKPWIGMM